nr:hypothetical protein BgiMline_003518 [Biomphalaria glabrata]
MSFVSTSGFNQQLNGMMGRETSAPSRDHARGAREVARLKSLETTFFKTTPTFANQKNNKWNVPVLVVILARQRQGDMLVIEKIQHVTSVETHALFDWMRQSKLDRS